MEKLIGSLIASLIVWYAIENLRQSKCSGDLATRLHCASIEATKIDWRPISVFPEEAKRFQEKNRGP